MLVNDEIALSYVNGEDISCYQNRWYYTRSNIEGYQGKNLFTKPSYEKEHKDKVATVCEAIKKTGEHFTPTNKAIWDQLCPDWKQVLDDIAIEVIVGYPDPFDATVIKDPDGKHHVIFDAGLWTAYVGQCDIGSVVQNLLTHELFHVLIGLHIPNIDEDTESKDYLTNLDANTFHEAFAHLVSYNAAEIDQTDWHSEGMEKVRKSNMERMKTALKETNPDACSKNLYDAVCGDYYDKYACMCGMLYLADCWEKGGIDALEQCFRAGYHQFAAKTVND